MRGNRDRVLTVFILFSKQKTHDNRGELVISLFIYRIRNLIQVSYVCLPHMLDLPPWALILNFKFWVDGYSRKAVLKRCFHSTLITQFSFLSSSKTKILFPASSIINDFSIFLPAVQSSIEYHKILFLKIQF